MMKDIKEKLRHARRRMRECFEYAYEHESGKAIDEAVKWEAEVERLEALIGTWERE